MFLGPFCSAFALSTSPLPGSRDSERAMCGENVVSTGLSSVISLSSTTGRLDIPTHSKYRGHWLNSRKVTQRSPPFFYRASGFRFLRTSLLRSLTCLGEVPPPNKLSGRLLPDLYQTRTRPAIPSPSASVLFAKLSPRAAQKL